MPLLHVVSCYNALAFFLGATFSAITWALVLPQLLRLNQELVSSCFSCCFSSSIYNNWGYFYALFLFALNSFSSPAEVSRCSDVLSECFKIKSNKSISDLDKAVWVQWSYSSVINPLPNSRFSVRVSCSNPKKRNSNARPEKNLMFVGIFLLCMCCPQGLIFINTD